MTNDAGAVIGLLGAMILVGSAVIVRTRTMPSATRWRMALLWVAIFALMFAIGHWIDSKG